MALPSAHTEPVVELVALEKRYGATSALRGVDLAVPAGTVVGLIGPNGAGKTTTMRILLDLIRPSAGRARVLGEDPRRGGTALRRRIGYLPGELVMNARVRVGNLLEYYAALNGAHSAEARISALAARLGLDLDRPVRTLSKGNKQKVGLVQAFVHDPELLVLDEPTSGLDPLMQQVVLELIREATAEGRTVLLSSHVISEIEQVADHVAILGGGRILAERTVDELRAAAARDVRVTVDATHAHALEHRLRALAGVDSVLRHEARGGEVTLSAALTSGVTELVAELATVPLTDLVIAPPDLERAVLQYYAPASSAQGAVAS